MDNDTSTSNSIASMFSNVPQHYGEIYIDDSTENVIGTGSFGTVYRKQMELNGVQMTVLLLCFNLCLHSRF
jgi:hypothetical protein